MAVNQRAAPVHALNVFRDEAHRPRAVERHHRNHMLQLGGTHLRQIAAHAGAFQLKHAGHFATPQQRIALWRVRGNIVQGELDAMARANHAAGALHHSQRAQAQKVHLEHAQMFEHVSFVLGGVLHGAGFS